MLVRLAVILTALLLAASPACAAVKDAARNKEGFWSVEADGDSCTGVMLLQGGSSFMLRGQKGEVAVALFAQSVLPRGKTFGLEIDGQVVDLPASFLPKEQKLVYLDGALDAASLARLRGGRQLRILIDGQAVASATLEGTGLPDTLDSLIACSQGDSGWWGKGVKGVAAPSAEPAKYVYNPEDVWVLAPSDDGKACFAKAQTDDKGRLLHFMQEGGDLTMAVTSPGPALPRGLKGELVLDAGIFTFKPDYDGKTLMIFGGSLSDQAVEALKATKGLSVRVDGKVLVDADLDGTGFPKILDELAACSRGEKGWWTANRIH